MQKTIQNINPETAVKELDKNGMKVSIEQAKSIVEFLYKLAEHTYPDIIIKTEQNKSKSDGKCNTA